MTRTKSSPPRLPCRLLSWALPISATSRSILGDLIEEYHRRPAGLWRALWFWLVACDVTIRYLPSRLRGEGFGGDVLHALRLFRRHRGLALAAGLSLALSIGIATSAFSVLNGTLVPFYLAIDPSEVRVWRTHARGADRAWPSAEIATLRERARTITLEVSTVVTMPFAHDAGGAGEAAPVHFVSGRYLTTFDPGRTMGRLLTAADDQAGSPLVAVLDRTFWRRYFGADRGVVGRTVWLGGTPVTIVGVAGRDFVDPDGNRASFWLPLSSIDRMRSGTETPSDPVRLFAVGGLAPGATRRQAETELSHLLLAIGTVTPGLPTATGVSLPPSVETNDIGILRTMLAGVLLVIVLLLVVTCANVSNLQLASAVTRRREIAVRVSLGASRWRVRRQLLTESFLLSAAAGAAGLLVSSWLSPILASVLGLSNVDVSADARVYAFVVAAAGLVTIGTALAPARYGVRGDVSECLKGASSGATDAAPDSRARSALVIVQAAASTIVVVLAALMIRAFVYVAWSDPGFDAGRLGVVSATFPESSRKADAPEFWVRALAAARATPGVENAALATVPPWSITMGDPDDVLTTETDAAYFSTVGVRVVRGRTYTAQEVATRAPVAVISERVARRFWGDQDPIGAMGNRIHVRMASVQIVGIVTDVLSGRRRTPIVYRPIDGIDNATLLIRSPQVAVALGIVTGRLEQLAVNTPLRATVVADSLAKSAEFPRRYAALALSIAVVVLGLSIVGVVGVTSFMARSRMREIGIRTALGAHGSDVLGLLVRDSMRPVAWGLVTGLSAALVVSQTATTFLYGISGHDPLAVFAAAAVIVSTALAAILIPASRAIRLDPAKVLRDS